MVRKLGRNLVETSVASTCKRRCERRLLIERHEENNIPALKVLNQGLGEQPRLSHLADRAPTRGRPGLPSERASCLRARRKKFQSSIYSLPSKVAHHTTKNWSDMLPTTAAALQARATPSHGVPPPAHFTAGVQTPPRPPSYRNKLRGEQSTSYMDDGARTLLKTGHHSAGVQRLRSDAAAARAYGCDSIQRQVKRVSGYGTKCKRVHHTPKRGKGALPHRSCAARCGRAMHGAVQCNHKR
jgi:hypothetical protein